MNKESRPLSEAQAAYGEAEKNLLFGTPLDTSWTSKEWVHYQDVRHLFIPFLLGLCVLGCFVPRLAHGCEVSVRHLAVAVVLMALIGCFFVLFWRGLHGLLFRNTYWQMTMFDKSYYVFPRSYFLNTILFSFLITLTFDAARILKTTIRESIGMKTMYQRGSHETV